MIPHNRKLTTEQVVEMRRRYREKEHGFHALGKIYGLSKIAARGAIIGISYSEVPDAVPAHPKEGRKKRQAGEYGTSRKNAKIGNRYVQGTARSDYVQAAPRVFRKGTVTKVAEVVIQHDTNKIVLNKSEVLQRLLNRAR